MLLTLPAYCFKDVFYPSSVFYHKKERVSHFGMDVVYSKLHQLDGEEITRNNRMPVGDYFVNLNTIYTADIIGVADPTCILL